MATRADLNSPEEHTQNYAEKGHQAIDRAAESARRAQEHIRHTSENLQQKSRETMNKLSEYVNEHPATSLGVAFAAGVLLAAIIKK